MVELFLLAILVIAVLLILLVLFYFIWFLRKPKLNLTGNDSNNNGNNFVLSPADGKIIEIIKYDKQTEKVNKGRFGKIIAVTKDVSDSGYIVCIAMNIFNVHYQISPINGVIKNINYVKGKFRNIFVDLVGLRFINNERNEILIESTGGKRNKKQKKFNVKVVQIAGLVARRIHCFVKPEQTLKLAQVLGVIKLGSMVLLIFPNDFNLAVKEGVKVKLGDTIAVVDKTKINKVNNIKKINKNRKTMKGKKK
ncbi:hypothetical protein HOC35_03425 [Candidatus Woesearchaeota archaeon]|jgi:phosphatidylserine decarboxylase|nr:hypothetical protein [Candidatus Woesearchaeota archaeon]